MALRLSLRRHNETIMPIGYSEHDREAKSYRTRGRSFPGFVIRVGGPEPTLDGSAGCPIAIVAPPLVGLETELPLGLGGIAILKVRTLIPFTHVVA